jgi:hypothetical protein
MIIRFDTVFQGDPNGVTRVLRVKVIAGIHLAKKDIFGARWVASCHIGLHANWFMFIWILYWSGQLVSAKLL